MEIRRRRGRPEIRKAERAGPLDGEDVKPLFLELPPKPRFVVGDVNAFNDLAARCAEPATKLHQVFEYRPRRRPGGLPRRNDGESEACPAEALAKAGGLYNSRPAGSGGACWKLDWKKGLSAEKKIETSGTA